MEKTLQVINVLEQEGVLSTYAIGGAMAATFYIEPVLTFDLDIFILLPPKGRLLTLAPLYEALRAKGYHEDGECISIEGVPVQFLPAYNALIEEALAQAVAIEYGKTPARVLRAEHLVAICLQTGRAKDRERVRLFREEASLDMAFLRDILKRHGLEEAWSRLNK